jgi:hypothetical protein
MFYVRTVLDDKAQSVDADDFKSTGQMLAFSKEGEWVKSFVIDNVVELWESDESPIEQPKSRRAKIRYGG